MIAHRLETIKTAENLLYLASSTNVEKGQIGTPEYDALMHKLIETNYAHQ
jgi:ABC-type transport system involved in Fe-S cluster assembly fused permease/ATPase subunit